MDLLLKDLSLFELDSRLSRFDSYHKPLVDFGREGMQSGIRAMLILVQYVLDKYPRIENLLKLNHWALRDRYNKKYYYDPDKGDKKIKMLLDVLEVKPNERKID